MLPNIHSDWFKNLYFGTTDKGRQELIDANETYSLIRIKHKGAWSGMESTTKSGYTEWVVAVNGELENKSYGFPKTLWAKYGRLLKQERKMIADKFKLTLVTKTKPRDKDGKYDFSTLSLMCKCGHPLSVHAGCNDTKARGCFNEVIGIEGANGESCNCNKFIKK